MTFRRVVRRKVENDVFFMFFLCENRQLSMDVWDFRPYFTMFLGPGRHQESLQKASAADLEENVSNRAFL